MFFPGLGGFGVEVFVVDGKVAGLLLFPEDVGAVRSDVIFQAINLKLDADRIAQDLDIGFVPEPWRKVARFTRPDGAEINLFEVA